MTSPHDDPALGADLPRRSFMGFLVLGTALPVALTLVLMLALLSYSGPLDPLRALGDAQLGSVVGLSLFSATIAALLGLCVAIPTAYVLARVPFPGRRFVDALLDIPVVLSPVAIGMMLLLVFRTGPGSWIQEHILRFVFELPGIVLAQFIVVSALQIRVLKATFEEIPPRFELVARLLGCGPWAAFRRVTLPMARPGLLSALILGWGRAMGEYGATVTIAGAMRGKTETIPVGIMLNWSAVRLDAAIGLILVLVFTTFLVLVALRYVGGRGR